MLDPSTSKSRKPWYQRAVQLSTIWKILTKSTPTTTNTTKTNLLKSLKTAEIQSNSNKQKLIKSTSLKVAATSFTRVCLCAPISSYNEVFNVDNVPPRRSYSYPRSKPYPPPPPQQPPAAAIAAHDMRIHSGRHSVEGRRIFRGKSLTDNVLMRRFVVEEEAMMQVSWRNQMKIIRKRAVIKRRKIGRSRLSRMVIAEDDQDC